MKKISKCWASDIFLLRLNLGLGLNLWKAKAEEVFLGHVRSLGLKYNNLLLNGID